MLSKHRRFGASEYRESKLRGGITPDASEERILEMERARLTPYLFYLSPRSGTPGPNLSEPSGRRRWRTCRTGSPVGSFKTVIKPPRTFARRRPIVPVRGRRRWTAHTVLRGLPLPLLRHGDVCRLTGEAEGTVNLVTDTRWAADVNYYNFLQLSRSSRATPPQFCSFSNGVSALPLSSARFSELLS